MGAEFDGLTRDMSRAPRPECVRIRMSKLVGAEFPHGHRKPRPHPARAARNINIIRQLCPTVGVGAGIPDGTGIEGSPSTSEHSGWQIESRVAGDLKTTLFRITLRVQVVGF